MNAPQSTVEPLAVSVLTAAKMTGVSRATFYRLIAEGRVKAKKIGKRTLVLVTDIHALLAASPTT